MPRQIENANENTRSERDVHDRGHGDSHPRAVVIVTIAGMTIMIRSKSKNSGTMKQAEDCALKSGHASKEHQVYTVALGDPSEFH
jgi:hypothetical protein